MRSAGGETGGSQTTPWRRLRLLAGSRIASDGAWSTLSQLGIALATLVSLRLMTGLLEPAAFGLLSLLVGVSALAVGLSATPFGQGLLRFHADWALTGRLAVLRRVGGGLTLRALSVMVVVVILAWLVASPLLGGTRWTGFLLAALVVFDAGRTFELVLLNAARRQKAVAVIGLADAWIRPLAAWLAIAVFGPTAEAALAGYTIGAGLVVAAMRLTVPLEGAMSTPATVDETRSLSSRLISYVLPLMPLGIFGWLSGIGDRYIVGGMLGLAAAGLYAAIYGLVSKPFMVAASSVELTLRPILYQAIAAGDVTRARRIQRVWLVSTAGVSLAGVIAIVILSPIIAWLLLAPPYRSAAGLMGWIALGYAIQSISNVYSRFCYAYDDTRAVLILTVAGATIGLGGSVLGAKTLGLPGVAIAVPIYFAVELFLSFLFGRRAERRWWLKMAAQGDADAA